MERRRSWWELKSRTSMKIGRKIAGETGREGVEHEYILIVFSWFVLLIQFAEYPFDTVKVLLQSTNQQTYTGPFDAVVKTYRKNGILGLYRGLPSPLLGSMAENATLFFAYGTMKRTLQVDTNPRIDNPVPLWKFLASGAFSGIFSTFVLTPIELIKVRIQVQNSAKIGETLKYSSTWDCVVKTIRSEGVLGLWQGATSCFAREIPGNMAWFGTYELVKRNIQIRGGYEYMEQVPLGWTALAGACAGVMYWAVPYPADTVKSRIQSSERFSRMSFMTAFRTILKEEGASGLYRGIGITCLRAAPSNALIFYVYEFASSTLATF